MSGWDSRIYENDSQVIKKIVNDVLKKLFLRYPTELKVKGLVGIDKMCEDIQFLLSKNKPNQSPKNVEAIGIWGMGGIGKTTIARDVFSKLFPLYDSVCFLENIRELSKKDQPSKLRALSNTLLSELLKEESPKFNPSGSTFIARRLSSKKVFIVLDDVDSSNQLDMLLEVCEYAAPGSKLIITTRNTKLLDGRVDKDDIYDAKPWSFDESLELFCLHAFKLRHPQEGYENLSKLAVKYAGGVPLALKVLGSNLCSRSTDFWDSELNKVKNYPYDPIENVLRVSYDGLNPLEKEIFLDIAFFFKDENKDFVKRILNACGFSATSGIVVLEEKALITIPNGEKIQMHDLLQDGGLNLVRQHIKNPRRRSRLRDIEEVSDVLQIKKGSDAFEVEGISLDLSHIDDLLSLSANTFDMMTKLRFLKLFIPSDKISGKVIYPRLFNKIPNKLRCLEWHKYPFKSLPATFSAKMLVEIRLPHSHVAELWQGVKDVVNLEVIDLSECKQLKNLPDLSKALRLKWLNLTSCESLLAVHPSVLSLDTLETLILDDCKKLKNLICKKHLRCLKEISVNGCTSLKEFSVSSDEIKKLDLSKTRIEKLYSSIGYLRKLSSLNLECSRLKDLPNELSSLGSLMDLRISNCRLVLNKQKLHVLFDGLRNLRELYFKNCCNLTELPANISGLSQLYKLRLDGSSVEILPSSIKDLGNLEILSLKNCVKLCRLPELPPCVKELNVINCRSLVTVSTLKTFAVAMKGKEKYFSFQNCVQRDAHTLHSIMEGSHLSMKSSVFQNVFVRKLGVEKHGYNYNFMKVSLPGSRIPECFTYRTTQSSFHVYLPSNSNLLGLVLCAVLSPSPMIKKHGAKIFCQFYLDGKKLGYATRWYHKAVRELNYDHVYMWYDPLHFDSIVRNHEQYLSVEFYVTDDPGNRDAMKICTKECGIHFIFDSDLNSFIQELDMDIRSKQSLALELSKELDIELEPELLLEFQPQD
ncbi:PREDICTED: TMV resistance protein N-like [Lupinus angustifolius]|uniref:TMV resistance protein N-like n=1 Tax=Lupinus angustifolius TaxID=3871 RepID=UPI00092F4A71|nr:PREDICTED: TMV resistance protein N-like [Lupinus angustifolius]